MELLNALVVGQIGFEIKAGRVYAEFNGHVGFGDSVEEAFFSAVDNFLADMLL